MDLIELKREQLRLASKIILEDETPEQITTIGGAACIYQANAILGCIIVCEFPSCKVLEMKTYLLRDALPHRSGYEAYREMPALLEAYNLLEQEPDLLLVKGTGILHPRNIGLASHFGLLINKPTIGVIDKLPLGIVENNIIILNNETVGIELKTRDFANPLYCSPGHKISLQRIQEIIPKTIHYPHKLPEPLHLALKMGKKKYD